MPPQAPPRLVSLPDRKPLNILPPSVALGEALCDLEENPPVGRILVAGSFMDLVARHCLGVPSMATVGIAREGETAAKGGPWQWSEIVRAIISTWPDDGPWNHWRGFVGVCVAVYAEHMQAPLWALDPVKVRKSEEEDGIEAAAALLSRVEPETPPPSEKSEAPKPNYPAVEAVDVKATAAAFALRQEGKPISLRAVCRRAGIDRDNLNKNYPATVSFIESMSRPDRAPKKGVRDRRTGGVDAIADD